MNDPLEHEADAVADKVMRMPDPSLTVSAAPVRANRKCDTCEDEDKKLQMKPARGQPHAPDSVLQVLSSPGQPLDPAMRAFFAPRLGRDLSSVRIHDDQHAAVSARDVGAHSYTVGEHIAFAAGQYAPRAQSGQRLLAHELAHVLQQQSGATALWRMAACPDHLLDTDPTPAGWRAYHGDSSVFHCGFRSILEARAGTPEDPENECVYDHSGVIVDEHHQYSGCRGTPDQYDSSDSPIRHALIDTGGIVMAGFPAFITSRVHDLDQAIAVAVEAMGIMQSLADRVGNAIARSVFAAIAVCDQTNWQITGLPARSVRHLRVASAILTSVGWAGGDVKVVLGAITKRLDDFSIANLLGEIAQDINTGLDAKTANIHVDADTIGRLSLYTLVDWLQSHGLIQYIRPTEIIGQEKVSAGKQPTGPAQQAAPAAQAPAQAPP